MSWQLIVICVLLQPVAAVGFALLVRTRDRHVVKALKRQRDKDWTTFRRERAFSDIAIQKLHAERDAYKQSKEMFMEMNYQLQHDLSKCNTELTETKKLLEAVRHIHIKLTAI